MANKIQFKRGKKASLPVLGEGEPGVCLDSKEVFVGGSSGNMQLITKEALDTLLMERCPVGSIMMWGTTTPPTGWLALLGQEVDRTTYANLFKLWGTTFGAGDGRTTFNVIDMRDRFPQGYGANRLGLSGGEATHILTLEEMPIHEHTTVIDTAMFGASSGNATRYVRTSGREGTINTGRAGGGQAYNIAPSHLPLAFIVKF